MKYYIVFKNDVVEQYSMTQKNVYIRTLSEFRKQ